MGNTFYLMSYLVQGRPARALCDAEMHHGQTRGERKTHNVLKRHVNLRKSGGQFEKVGGNINFTENRGKFTNLSQ